MLLIVELFILLSVDRLSDVGFFSGFLVIGLAVKTRAFIHIFFLLFLVR